MNKYQTINNNPNQKNTRENYSTFLVGFKQEKSMFLVLSCRFSVKEVTSFVLQENETRSKIWKMLD